MKHRLLFATALAALIAFPLGLWLLEADSKLELKIIRRTAEEGRPVAYFRVEGCEGRKIQIGEVEQLAQNRILQWADLLAVFRDPKTVGVRELRLVGPTDVPAWKVRITVHVEQPSLVERLKTARAQWQTLRSMKYPLPKILKEIWTTPTFTQSSTIESDWITNAVRIIQAK